MDNETEIVKKHVQNLPQGMRDYLVKDTWPQKLSLIKQMNKLTEEQAAVLKTEIFLILIGIENQSDLKENIQKNVLGISVESAGGIADDIEKNIFSEIKPFLDEIEKANNQADKIETPEIHPNKETILNDIENPTPVKPIIQNPAGKNPILDAQHNLPVGETRKLISSAAVPSRGPILSHFKTSFGTEPVAQVAPVAPIAPITPVANPVIPAMPKPIEQQPTHTNPIIITTRKPVSAPVSAPIPPIAQPTQPQPPVQPVQPIQPTQPQTPPQPSTPATPSTPPAPSISSADPYREPLE